MQLFGKSCVLGQGWEHTSHCGALEVHFRKSPCVFSAIHWTLRAITKLPFNKFCPFLFSLIFLLLCYRPTPVKKVSTKYKFSTTQLSPVYHHNPFQHLIIQTQNQQNQTKNNSKSTQNRLKSTQTLLENPSQTQLKIKPKIHKKINSKLNH